MEIKGRDKRDDKKDRLRDRLRRNQESIKNRRNSRGDYIREGDFAERKVITPLNWVEVKPSWKSCNPKVLRYLGSEDGLNTRTSLQIVVIGGKIFNLINCY